MVQILLYPIGRIALEILDKTISKYLMPQSECKEFYNNMEKGMDGMAPALIKTICYKNWSILWEFNEQTK